MNTFVIMLIAIIMFRNTVVCKLKIRLTVLSTNRMMLVAVNILMKLCFAAIIRSIADISSSVYMCFPFTKNYITQLRVG